MKLKPREVAQIIKALKALERRYENSGRGVNAEDMQAVRSAIPKFEELRK